ncbi:alpha/beta hydrolase [Streptacidiphilus cavernicola]|uniref:Alpha/beta hydrolase n=1 Tax=Streptacidiphilus cavernicola TaxID=3342716 RepID=A0ABV6VX81_9ACTN
MGLTSQKLQILIAALAVVCFAAAVWLWPRLSGRSWRALLGRIGALLVSQLLTLMAIALAANNWGAFYSSWSDLLGTDQGGGAVTIGGPPVASTGSTDGPRSSVDVQGSKPVALQLPGHPGLSGGTVQQVSIHGGGTGLTEPGFVYLPPQYQDPAYAKTRFPVIVVFTGYPGNATSLITRMKYPTVAAQAIQQQQMSPTILVLMRPSVAMPRDTECQDVPGGPQAESFFTRDLRQAMASRYRAETQASGWGVIGDSTGGYCALKITMRHPEAYTVAASLSGYYKSAVDSTTGSLFGGSSRLQDENDLMWRLKNLPHPKVSLLVSSSKKGEGDYRATLAFAAAANGQTSVGTLILPEGGHNFGTWNRETPAALRWMSARLSPPLSGSSVPGPVPGTGVDSS